MGALIQGIAVGATTGALVDSAGNFAIYRSMGMSPKEAARTALKAGGRVGVPVGAAAGGVTVIVTHKDFNDDESPDDD